MTVSESRQIILDGDPGHDDAVAIMLALGNPAIELLGITTVGGNQTVDKVTRNAQSVLAMCGREDVPVHAGSHRPLVRRVEVAPDIHGKSGLDGVELPEPTRPAQDTHAVHFIINTVMAAEPVDPETAAIVFDEAWPLTMVGLDLTHQALASR